MRKDTSAYQKITPKVVYQLAAPHSWAPASIIPVLFASVLTLRSGLFSAGLFYILLCAAILMQSAVNALNDYYDFVRGTDTLANSPDRDDAVLVYNRLNPTRVRLVGGGFLLAALLLGAYVVYTTNYIPLIIGIIGTVTVVAYSAGPRPLSYMPLGEFASGIVMGILLPVAVYAAITGDMNWHLMYLCLPLMLGIALIMLTNNSCDIERDSKAGRRTLPVLLGRLNIRIVHRTLLMFWILSILVILLINYRAGLFILPLGLLAGWRGISNLFTATLIPAYRVSYMKDIFQVNLYINGTYTLCVLLDAVRF